MTVNPFNPKCPKLPWMVEFYTCDDGKVYDNQLQAAFANTALDYLSSLNIKSKPSKFRDPIDMFYFGNYFVRLGRIYPLGIALEIKGPEIRTGTLKGPENQIFLEKGKITNLTTDPSYEEHVTKDMIFVDYENLTSVVQPGDRVLLDNGSVALSALGMYAPIELPLISASDRVLLKASIDENIDYLFISGVYNKEGILQVKEELGQEGKSILIFPKVDSSVCIENINKILEVSDGLCLDCDRLMAELPKEKVFLVQKSILAKCNLAGKPGICSLKISDLRALSKSEVCDIANAIIDGTDALLVPPEACEKELVQSMVVICKEAEPAVHQKQIFNELTNNITSPMEALYALAISAVESALKTNAAAIICLTSSGRTAKLLSRFRPRCPIIAITRYIGVASQLMVFRGIEPILYLRPFGGFGTKMWRKECN
ncbi:hypothetical protein NQ317_012569 [Molorchus minor]|uniref:Pyruvate kinase n=1 Tax=Molorchus minor TaxID=1323400 RepID=A0ABQ9K160_9CUCU|nr:hypothetical protein NQ317_012569 [Molorchus minor]